MLLVSLLFILTTSKADDPHNHRSIQVHPDVGLNVRQLIERYGYPFENHTVRTEDGYLLEVHRVPHGNKDLEYNNQRPPILLAPGLLCSSADFVNMGPENSLGFILADHGYDVWLANYRGTRWSRKHTMLNPDKDKKQFWNYSFHEYGYYDIAAFVDHILEQTNHTQVFYAGHSLGTTTYFILASARPEYNEKVRLAVALAPAAYVTSIPNSFVILWIAKQIERFVDMLGLYEILPYNPFWTALGTILCSDGSISQDLCASFLLAIGGNTPDQLNKTMIPMITSNAPAGASFKQMVHFLQLAVSGKFRWYDYGAIENLKRYGQLVPPNYDLGKITAPLAFYYGDHDTVCPPEIIDKTASEVSSLVVNRIIKGFNHLDVLWGIDAAKVVFSDILELMKRY